jgi:fatty-acid desaturase
MTKEQFKVYVFLPLMHIVLLYGLFTSEHTLLILLSGIFLYFPLHHLGNGIGYHRLFSHNAFKPKRWYPYLSTFLSSISFFGSPMEYAVVHRVHHQNSDKPGDPHSPVDGRLHAYITWITKFKPTHKQLLKVKDLGKSYPWMIKYQSIEWLVPIVFYSALFAINSTAGYIILLASLLSLHAAMAVNAFAHTTKPIAGQSDNSMNILWAAKLISPIFLHHNHHTTGDNLDYSTAEFTDRWSWVIKHFLMEKKDA